MSRHPSFAIQLSLLVGAVLLVGIVAILQVSETGDTWNEQTAENTVGLAGLNTGTCPLQASLYGGKTQKYEVEGNTYVIRAVLQGQSAILTVNGASTPALGVGASATLPSGAHVKIKSIMNTWRDKRVTFCLTPPAGEPTPTTGITCPIDGVTFAPSNPDFLGLVGNELQIAIYYNASLPYLAQKYAEAGVRQVRIVATWEDIEPTPGTHNWYYTDKRINEMSVDGIDVVGILVGTPEWATSCPDNPSFRHCIAKNMNDYQTYVRDVVRRYGPSGTGQVRDWEIRVESNGNNGTPTKEDYVKELNAAYEVIKQEDPQARVWGPEVYFVVTSPGAYEWVDYVIANGHYDVFSIHQFHNVTTAYTHTKRVRELLDAAGQEDIPLAVSAMNSEYNTARTQEQQAKALKELYACVSSAGADYAMWFSGTEWPDVSDPNKFGIFDYDFTVPEHVRPKLAYYALKELGDSINGSGTPSTCGPGQQPLRYNAGAGALTWTTAGAYSPEGISSLWTSGEPGKCCDQGTQCAFPTGCQNDGAFMGNYSYVCASDQGQGVIFGCTDAATDRDGQKLLGNVAYCCSKYSADYNQGNAYFHALPGQRRFGLAALDEKREITRPDYDACTDGSDNDCDGFVDAQDPDCGDTDDVHQMPVACVPGGEPARVTQEFLGMGMKEAGPWLNTLTNTTYLEWMTQRLDDAGVRSTITGVGWSSSETQNNTFNWYNDPVIANLTLVGIRPIAAISNTPTWASSNPNSDKPGAYPPRNMDDWRDAVRQAVRHYGPAGKNQVKDWKIWNEPNGLEYWRGTREEFTALLNAGYDTIKQEDPTAKVWAPGVVYHENNKGSTGYNNPDAWVDHIIAHGKFDVLTIHMYYRDPVEMRDTIRRVRQKLDTAGKQGVPIAVTEFNIFDLGGPNCPYWNLTEAQQAQNLRRAYACVADGGAASAYWFTATDRPNTAANCPGGWVRSGVFTRSPVATKLSYDALREIGVALGTATAETPPPAPQPSTGTLTADPNPCVIAADSKRCSTTISWSTTDVAAPYVKILADDAFFACAQANVPGQKVSTTIGEYSAFALYSATSCESRERSGDAIAKLEVRGVPLSTDTAQKTSFTTTIARAAAEEKG